MKYCSECAGALPLGTHSKLCDTCRKERDRKYRRDYYRTRYREDEEYRERMKGYVRKYSLRIRREHGIQIRQKKVILITKGEWRRRRWKMVYGENAVKRLEFAGTRCECCNSAYRLLVHHLDWNRENNAYENLRILCRDCHASLHSFVHTCFPQQYRQEIVCISMDWKGGILN